MPVAGNVNLTAEYPGDGIYTTAVSIPIGLTVLPASTTTTIQSHTPDPAIPGSPVVFTATVDDTAPAAAGLPTGAVIFADSSNTYSCTVTAAPWTCNITFPTSGTYTVTASYTGDLNFSSSVSSPVTQTVILP
jgi:hypothetical protein